ncbi:MAG: VaFE repeat-containing surface-anchored protein [Ilumatobacteraceae bacterium]
MMLRTFRKMVGAVALAVAIGVPVVSTSPPEVEATAPTAALCNGNNAFCGYALHVKNGTTTVLPSKAFGAHYGPGWSMPTGPNNSTGIGFCLDDTFGGVPVGPVSELALPAGWTTAGIRQAAYILTMYAGDRVVPYQPIAIDAAGEFPGFTTRQRYEAVHLALLSVLPNHNNDGTYAALLDPATMNLFSDAAGMTPSAQQVVAPLVAQIVAAAQADHADGSGLVLTAEETSPGVVTVTALRDGLPVPNLPVWPTSTTGVTYSGSTGSTAYTNAAAASWPSLDYSTTRAGAGVTNASGVATFTATSAALAAGVEFNTEEPPAAVHQHGDGLNSQGNLTWLASEMRQYNVPVGRLDLLFLSSQVSSATPSIGTTLSDSITVEALADETTATVEIQAFDLTVDPTGSGTPLVSVQVPGLLNGTTTGLAPLNLTVALAGHTIGYRHRAVSLSDGSLTEPTAWSVLGIPSETAVVNGLLTAETHLRKSVSGDGTSWFNTQAGTSPSYDPATASADPRDGSHDDGAADAGDAVPVFPVGTPVSFRYEVWLDAASTGVVKFANGTTGVVTDDNGTPANSADDFKPSYLSGDDGDGVLEPAETWVYEASEIRTAVAGEVYSNYSAIPSGEIHNPGNPGGPSEGDTTPRKDPAGYVVPSCSTTAVNPADDTNFVGPQGGTVVDTVSCVNLVAGESVTVSGELQKRAADGSVAGTGITASTTFTPATFPDSVTTVSFSVPGSATAGTFVVFETVTADSTGVVVAEHKDAADEDQTFVKRSALTVSTNACTVQVELAKGVSIGANCDVVVVGGDPGDQVAGRLYAVKWVGGARECSTISLVVEWQATLNASGTTTVTPKVSGLTVGDWEFLHEASTPDGRTNVTPCDNTTPRNLAESFKVIPNKSTPGKGIPGTGADSVTLLVAAGLLVGTGLAGLFVAGVGRRRRSRMA